MGGQKAIRATVRTAYVCFLSYGPVYLLCVGTMISQPSYGQSHNGELYRLAFSHFLDSVDHSPAKIDGYLPRDWTPAIRLNSLSPVTWQVLTPSIQYKTVAQKQYERTFTWHLTMKDSLLQHYSWTYVDTLTRKELKQVLHKSPPDISGDDPTRHGRLWVPLAWIGGGTVLSVGLFVVRSILRD